ncbi:hypothetical protein BJ138DRAFT_1119268 [Hygrophoropsis aurantiaca]|uniref:Uncharacterized protein n=1 Tax=Hygrophoropsis aurantiaca TaxID=72124 RepID=A0ACB7ZV77_9AGAM|nr:hypothetical protein BJ138DRAFT_1119268 [Hygrophoropsis aurantiaca]
MGHNRSVAQPRAPRMAPDAGWASRNNQSAAHPPSDPNSQSKGKGKQREDEPQSSDSDSRPKSKESKLARRRDRWVAPLTTYEEGWSTDEDERNLTRILGTSRITGRVAPYDEPPPRGEPSHTAEEMAVDEVPQEQQEGRTTAQRINFVDDRWWESYTPGTWVREEGSSLVVLVRGWEHWYTGEARQTAESNLALGMPAPVHAVRRIRLFTNSEDLDQFLESPHQTNPGHFRAYREVQSYLREAQSTLYRTDAQQYALRQWRKPDWAIPKPVDTAHRPLASRIANEGQAPSVAPSRLAPSKKKTSAPAQPKLDVSPEEWKVWHEHHKTGIRGVVLSTDNVADVRAIRRWLLVAQLAPNSSRQAELLVVPGYYREIIMHVGMDIAATRTAHHYNGGAEVITAVDVAIHFAHNGVTWAEADDAWTFADA